PQELATVGRPGAPQANARDHRAMTSGHGRSRRTGGTLFDRLGGTGRLSSGTESRHGASPSEVQAAHSGVGGTILVVEDDPFISDALEEVLEEFGYGVV